MLSIIIPTLNEEKIIGKTLEGLKPLTLPHQIIVSDGGSTDHTVEIAKEKSVAVTAFSGPRRQNIAQGRNAGAKLAEGEFLVFLDADCFIPDPDTFFNAAFARFKQDPNLVAINANVRVFPDMATLGDRLVFGAINLGLRLTNNIFNRGEALGEFQMMKKDAFLRLGGFSEHLITREDADMFRRLSGIGRVLMPPELTVFHTGRRAHTVGWSRMIFMWAVNTFFVNFFKRAYSKEWKVIR